MVLVIIIAIILIAVIGLIIYFKKSNKLIKTAFENSSTYTFGAKGKGKDLLFQKVINLRKKEGYYSNIYYGGAYNHLSLKQLNVGGNKVNDLILNTITPIEKIYLFEQRDLYISDAGIYLPNYEDNRLNKEYPEMPLFVAVQRHLLLSNTHINSQAYGRVWKKIREQCDIYIKALKVIKTPFGLIGKIRMYDKESAAEADIRPYRKKLFKKNSLSESDFYSTNGNITERFYFISKRAIKYDTRAFKRIFKIYD